MKPLRVLVVDSSAVVRQTLSEVFGSDPGIEVMRPASDPPAAARRIREETPDVIVLDIETPHMDGLAFVQEIMTRQPIPVIVFSSLAGKGADRALLALEYGVVEVFPKPEFEVEEFLREERDRLCGAVKQAAKARLRTKRPAKPVRPATAGKVVLVGVSTGGPEALPVVLEALPPDSPGVLIVQHMPERYTTAFAHHLEGQCALEVKEAETGDLVRPGRALLAPGNRHLTLKAFGGQYFAEVRLGPRVCRHRPSVDVLFRSGARYAGPNAVGVLLTGMGNDGAGGLLELKQAGAATIAQDESTSEVFGMPGEAIRLGAAGRVLPIEKIAPAILETCQ